MSAVELSRENAVRNGLRNVTVFCGEAFARSKSKSIISSSQIPHHAGKQCLLQMFSAAHRHLLPGGRFAFVARTQQGAKTLAKAVEQIFGNITDLARGGGYRVYMAYKDADATVALD